MVPWERRKGLSLSSVKTTALLFTTKSNKDLYRTIKVGNANITLSNQAVYLGVIFDDKLLWKAHIDNKILSVRNNLFNCQRAVGKTWGLEPKNMKWLYNQAALPSLTYGAVVWHDKALRRKGTVAELHKLQYLAARMITRGLRSSASVNLEVMAGLLPIDLKIKEMALLSACRLKLNGKWDGNYHHPKRMHLTHARTLDIELTKI